MYKKIYTFLFVLIAGVITANTVQAQSGIPANIAFGMPTRGGIGGKVLRVTNLNPDGPGSFKTAVKTAGARIVVFEVGGVIDLAKTRLTITEPYITIAGQTAPSPGITIIKGGINIKTHDVVMQHVRIRPGDAGMPKKSGFEPDGLSTVGGNAYNIIIDHCSFTWAVDENLSASGARNGVDSTSHKITFSNNIIAEALCDASHTKGVHSMGSLIHDFVQDIAIAGNLYASNNQRNPFFKAFTKGVFANNVIYNPGSYAIQMFWVPEELAHLPYKPQNGQVSVVGNVLYKGINSKKNMAMLGRAGDVFLEDNQAWEMNGDTVPMIAGDIKILTTKPSWPDNFTAMPASKVPAYIIRHAGARPKDRDAVDQRIIREFAERKSRLISSQEEVGGYPNYTPVTRKLDVPAEGVEAWLQKMSAEVE